jgi:photosystem II stability/assembly factor-like uncharacterized protein
VNQTDDLLDLMNGLRPVMLDRLADDGYARRRSGDLARVAAQGHREPLSAAGPRRWAGSGPGRLHWSRPLRRLPAIAAATAAVVALLVVAAQFGPWHPGEPARRSGPSAGPGSVREPSAASSQMRVLTSVSWAFRLSGAGPQASSLDCVTALVCYVWDADTGGHTAYRTSDGGATWHPLAALPGGLSLSGVNAGPPSCPTAEMCAGVAGGMNLALTTDGGASWRVESLPAPAGAPGASISEVACGTAAWCVVQAGGTFLVTVNGGTTWTAAGVVPQGTPDLWYLRCDPDGRCIGLAPTGTNTNAGIESVLSADNGRTWAVSGSNPTPASELFMVSCGDALHCMDLSDRGTTATTSNGGVTWQDTAPVGTSAGSVTPLTVSCAVALDCFVAVSAAGGGGYVDAAIEATSDGGASWTTIGLPPVGGRPLAEVFPLSCPSQDGCIGVAATPQQANGADTQREIVSSFPSQTTP